MYEAAPPRRSGRGRTLRSKKRPHARWAVRRDPAAVAAWLLVMQCASVRRTERRRTVGGSCSARVDPARRRFGRRRGHFRRAAEGRHWASPEGLSNPRGRRRLLSIVGGNRL
eukprot:6039811-Prymnesium_polylepis.1